MKIARFALIALALTACIGAPVDTWVEQTFAVDVASGNVLTETKDSAIDLSGLKNTEGLKVQEITIPEIILETSQLGSENKTAKVSGSVAIAVDGAEAVVVANFTDLAVTEGASHSLTLDTAAQKAVGAAMLKGTAATAKTSYTLDAVPAKFQAKCRIHLNATVGLL